MNIDGYFWIYLFSCCLKFHRPSLCEGRCLQLWGGVAWVAHWKKSLGQIEARHRAELSWLGQTSLRRQAQAIPHHGHKAWRPVSKKGCKRHCKHCLAMHLWWCQDAASDVSGVGRAGAAARCQIWFSVTTGWHSKGLTRHTKIAKITNEGPTFATALSWSSSSIPIARISHCTSALGRDLEDATYL